ncbi:hypothetical protein BO82DRAFT_345786 [Aspergillus uvarum CBS 121591]|uniref:Conidiation protein Con-6 n=3 Tax=Aspergillus TaxID=5052 RepID=A0A319BXX8_9EURO|nr:hypothetical protein BO82DRAFT_345786 [Aspergillus uvarum CBS 121591]PYH77071.1 hypothetical protein BO82DRAFT_345786 [Aspergillus uvarum CBS 121591]PYI14304.1 hypothetical protein BO99DRAFT_345355 [Aspergillus violaceofuscus CBS 115571]
MSSAEDRVNAMRGYKATTNNPRVSDEAKQNAQSMLDQLGGSQPSDELHDLRGDNQKDPNRVAGGLKAAQNNPGVSQQGKEAAAQKLNQMGGPDE